MSQHDPKAVEDAAKAAKNSYLAWWLKADAKLRKEKRKRRQK